MFLWNLQISKCVTSSLVLLHKRSYTYAYFSRVLSTIKMKFCQILVCCMTNISNIFLPQCWRLETSSRLFYDFIKMTIQQDLAILSNWHLLFLNVPHSPFQKNETMESWYNLLLSNWSRLLIWKGPGTLPQSSKLFKRFLKTNPLIYIYQLVKFGDLMWFKTYIKKYILSLVLIFIITSQIW